MWSDTLQQKDAYRDENVKSRAVALKMMCVGTRPGIEIPGAQGRIPGDIHNFCK